VRITIVIGPYLPIPPILGGATEKVNLTLAHAFAEAGHQVTIISRLYDRLPSDEVAYGVRHIRIRSFDRRSSAFFNLILGLFYSLRAARALRSSDITITNEFFAPLILSRSKAGKIYVQVGRYPKHQMWLYFRATRLQAVSQSVAEAIKTQTSWLAPRVKTIGPALADKYFARDPAAARENTVLFVGRIAKEKGIDLLIRAFVHLKRDPACSSSAQWRLRIIGPYRVSEGGDGESFCSLLRFLSKDLGDCCEFMEPIFNETELIQEYRRSAIFVYPSIAETGEAFGLAPLEAMACGCAAVVSNLACFDDFIKDGVSGLRFDHREKEAEKALADRLVRLINDRPLLQQVAANGYREASRFKADVVAAEMLADFRGLLERG